MQQEDYTSTLYSQFPHLQNPNPNPNPNRYASAPPFTTSYSPSDYSVNRQNFPHYPQNHPDSVPAPSYAPSNPNPNSQSSFPTYEPHWSYQPLAQQQPFYPPFDQHQTVPNYLPNPSPSLNPDTPYSSLCTGTYSQAGGASVPPVYENLYENSAKFDLNSGYFDEGYRNYGRARPDSGCDNVYGDGVCAYEGGKVEPYGTRGTALRHRLRLHSVITGGQSVSPSAKDSLNGLGKIVRAVPKAETHHDVKSGVQKFRVKVLAETAGQSTKDVLCQIGLVGIQMLDSRTSQTLRVYTLEEITRCDVTNSSTFVFWAQRYCDIEPRRVRLQSKSYTTNTILDTVTAAIVQLKEMGASSRPSDSVKTTEQATEKKKGFADWMNLIKPGDEEKDHWVPDEVVSKCTACWIDFGAFHHCRNCGDIFCDNCTHDRIALTADENARPVRVCDRCMQEVTKRLRSAKEAASKRAGLQSHEALARKLQEVMEKNRKASSVSNSERSGKQMREVVCPTCTVHLQDPFWK